MKMLTVTLALCACLLQGCESPSNSKTSPTEKSPPTTITRQTPDEIVAALNRLYDDVQQNDCREIGSNLPRGHYYCSGLLVRTPLRPNVNPWTFSPDEVDRGSASFSWFRRDLNQTETLTPAGFIVRTVKQGQSDGLPGYDAGLICLYPFDASTFEHLLHNGCGVRQPTVGVHYPQPNIPHLNAAHAWGSCEQIGIKTEEEWRNYTGPLGRGREVNQCSWNAESQSGWNNAIATRPHYPGSSGIWNELLMATVDDGFSLKDFIPAVFIDAKRLQEGLETARTYQTRLASSGQIVPIVRLDFTQQVAFSYHTEDQVIPQP